MNPLSETYAQTKSAMNDVLDDRDYRRRDSDAGRWPQWAQLLLSVGAVIVAVVLAYSALDKRISLIEQKLDYISHQVSK